MKLDNICIIVPSYNPDEKLREVLLDLGAAGFSRFVVVNDGSADDKLQYFPKDGEYAGSVILHHQKNRGKGAALKTAYEYVLSNMPDCSGVITVDGDNQHASPDVVKCAQRMLCDDCTVLGVRDFSLPHVPKRSRFGNRLTSFVFRFACGMKISDTQTGLRAFPARYLKWMCGIGGERYEYETNVLLAMNEEDVPFAEEKISTVYIDENATSHFHPIRDSLKIYRLLFKYILSSAASAIIDIFLFWLFSTLFGSYLGGAAIVTCTVAARCISAFFNFEINMRRVFKSGSTRHSLWRYAVVAVLQMLLSALLLECVSRLFGAESSTAVTALKIAVDLMLFAACFKLQQSWVFKKEKHS